MRLRWTRTARAAAHRHLKPARMTISPQPRGRLTLAIARRLGVPRTHVRDWLHAPARGRASRALLAVDATGAVRRAESYADAARAYLGDGLHQVLVRAYRATAAHLRRGSTPPERPRGGAAPALLPGRTASALGFFPAPAEGTGTRGRWWSDTTAISAACSRRPGRARSTSARCVFEPWQRTLVEAEPWRFLRGCIRTDGCVFVNRTGRYEYLSYEFSNLSRDIVDLFMATCERPGSSTAPLSPLRTAVPARRRSPSARRGRDQVLTTTRYPLASACGCGGTGRRAAFRSPWV